MRRSRELCEIFHNLRPATALVALLFVATPVGASRVQSRVVHIQAEHPNHVESIKRTPDACTAHDWTVFLQRFGSNGTAKLASRILRRKVGLSTRPVTNFSFYRDNTNIPCETGNVLILAGTFDDNHAFRFDRYACSRLLRWSSIACSVVVRSVSGNSEVSKILQEYKAGSIQHLHLAGHGSGGKLRWNNLSDTGNDYLRTAHRPSLETLRHVATAVVANGTIFLESCMAATFHEEECLAHYVSRMVGKDVQVFGSVYCFSAQALSMTIDQSVPYAALVDTGTRVFKHSQTLVHEILAPAVLAPKMLCPNRGDWVNTFFATDTGDLSPYSVYGKVVDVSWRACTVDAELPGPKGRLKRQTLTIMCTRILRYLGAGDRVWIRPSRDGVRPQAIGRFFGATGEPGDRLMFRVFGQDGKEENLKADEFWPVGQEPPVLGRLYAETGDWIHVYDEADTSDRQGDLRGVVVSQTRFGPRYVAEIRNSSREVGAATTLDIRAGFVFDVGKPDRGQRVIFFDSVDSLLSLEHAPANLHGGVYDFEHILPTAYEGELLSDGPAERSEVGIFRVRDVDTNATCRVKAGQILRTHA
eukprot:TRINITY_DN75521_c0_g1_i1.p1 TRINITY_DN75521_c0_g1~~TRINITY_DN75521_c0_g1_i1.p1  ORF type:complete len:608 (-),score=42.26 TRINITY_DN75521_c0_g1_i1:148-1905(-)